MSRHALFVGVLLGVVVVGLVAMVKRPRSGSLMEVTAYCPCKLCCGPHARGITASGQRVSANGGVFVAAPRSLPFYTRVKVPGYAGGGWVPVLDRGGAITDGHLDVFFRSHEVARQWGRRRLWVEVSR